MEEVKDKVMTKFISADMIGQRVKEIADEIIRVLKKDGNLFIFTSYNLIGKWHDALDHKFDATNFMVWHKTNPTPKFFKNGFLNSCEIASLTKTFYLL